MRHSTLSKEQQGFRKNRSTVYAVFIVRQVIKKVIEYNIPAYLCFIDMTKTFDRIHLMKVERGLKHRGIHPNIIQKIK